MRRLSTLLMLCASSLALSSTTWTSYAPMAGDFRVSFPTKSISQVPHTVSTGQFNVTYTTYVGSNDSTKCVVTECTLPPKMPPDERDRFMKAIMEGFLSNSKASKYAESPMKLGPISGSYATLLHASAQTGIWIAEVNGTIFALSCSAVPFDYANALHSFTSSFHINSMRSSSNKNGRSF